MLDLNLRLSQVEFAQALQEWEQYRRTPSGSAHALIKIVVRHPEIIRESFDIQHKKQIETGKMLDG